jgi:hypothetical protein
MSNPPCICPKNEDGLRTATDPKCFDHAQWTRHPSDYIVRLRIPHRAKIAAASLIAAAALVPLSTLPAQAATYITVCNATYSYERIRAYNNDVGYSKTLYPGQCSSSVRDDNGHARVDVDPAGNVDVDSWTKRHIGDPWTSLCYPGEKHDQDPYSGSGAGTSIWNFQTSNCTIG